MRAAYKNPRDVLHLWPILSTELLLLVMMVRVAFLGLSVEPVSAYLAAKMVYTVKTFPGIPTERGQFTVCILLTERKQF